MSAREAARPIVGVDLGASNVRAGLLAPGGERVERVVRRAVPPSRGVEDVVAAIVALVREAAAGDAARVGVGVAAWMAQPGGRVVVSPNLGWRDVPLQERLGQALGTFVRVENDLNAIAWGEFQAGAARGARDVLCVYVGSGIGGGLVLDGRLYGGSTGLAGEIGHTRVVPGVDGRACACGGRGCLEAYAGGAGIAARVREEIAAGVKTALAAPGVESPGAADVERAAQAGDAYARSVLDEAGAHLATAVGGAITVWNPDRVVLGGSVWTGSPTLRRSFASALPSRVIEPALAAARIVDAELGDDAGVLGAALLARDADRAGA